MFCLLVLVLAALDRVFAVQGYASAESRNAGFDVSFYHCPRVSGDAWDDPLYFLDGYAKQQFLGKKKGIVKVDFSKGATELPGLGKKIYGFNTKEDRITYAMTGWFYAEKSGAHTFNVKGSEAVAFNFGGNGSPGDSSADDGSASSVESALGDNTVVAVHPDTVTETFDLTEGNYYPIKIVAVATKSEYMLRFSYKDPEGTLHSDFGRKVFQVQLEPKTVRPLEKAQDDDTRSEMSTKSQNRLAFERLKKINRIRDFSEDLSSFDAKPIRLLPDHPPPPIPDYASSDSKEENFPEHEDFSRLEDLGLDRVASEIGDYIADNFNVDDFLRGMEQSHGQHGKSQTANERIRKLSLGDDSGRSSSHPYDEVNSDEEIMGEAIFMNEKNPFLFKGSGSREDDHEYEPVDLPEDERIFEAMRFDRTNPFRVSRKEEDNIYEPISFPRNEEKAISDSRFNQQVKRDTTNKIQPPKWIMSLDGSDKKDSAPADFNPKFIGHRKDSTHSGSEDSSGLGELLDDLGLSYTLQEKPSFIKPAKLYQPLVVGDKQPLLMAPQSHKTQGEQAIDASKPSHTQKFADAVVQAMNSKNSKNSQRLRPRIVAEHSKADSPEPVRKFDATRFDPKLNKDGLLGAESKGDSDAEIYQAVTPRTGSKFPKGKNQAGSGADTDNLRDQKRSVDDEQNGSRSRNPINDIEVPEFFRVKLNHIHAPARDAPPKERNWKLSNGDWVPSKGKIDAKRTTIQNMRSMLKPVGPRNGAAVESNAAPQIKSQPDALEKKATVARQRPPYSMVDDYSRGEVVQKEKVGEFFSDWDSKFDNVNLDGRDKDEKAIFNYLMSLDPKTKGPDKPVEYNVMSAALDHGDQNSLSQKELYADQMDFFRDTSKDVKKGGSIMRMSTSNAKDGWALDSLPAKNDWNPDLVKERLRSNSGASLLTLLSISDGSLPYGDINKMNLDDLLKVLEEDNVDSGNESGEKLWSSDASLELKDVEKTAKEKNEKMSSEDLSAKLLREYGQNSLPKSDRDISLPEGKEDRPSSSRSKAEKHVPDGDRYRLYSEGLTISASGSDTYSDMSDASFNNGKASRGLKRKYKTSSSEDESQLQVGNTANAAFGQSSDSENLTGSRSRRAREAKGPKSGSDTDLSSRKSGKTKKNDVLSPENETAEDLSSEATSKVSKGGEDSSTPDASLSLKQKASPHISSESSDDDTGIQSSQKEKKESPSSASDTSSTVGEELGSTKQVFERNLPDGSAEFLEAERKASGPQNRPNGEPQSGVSDGDLFVTAPESFAGSLVHKSSNSHIETSDELFAVVCSSAPGGDRPPNCGGSGNETETKATTNSGQMPKKNMIAGTLGIYLPHETLPLLNTIYNAEPENLPVPCLSEKGESENGEEKPCSPHTPKSQSKYLPQGDYRLAILDEFMAAKKPCTLPLRDCDPSIIHSIFGSNFPKLLRPPARTPSELSSERGSEEHIYDSVGEGEFPLEWEDDSDRGSNHGSKKSHGKNPANSRHYENEEYFNRPNGVNQKDAVGHHHGDKKQGDKKYGDEKHGDKKSHADHEHGEHGDEDHHAVHKIHHADDDFDFDNLHNAKGHHKGGRHKHGHSHGEHGPEFDEENDNFGDDDFFGHMGLKHGHEKDGMHTKHDKPHSQSSSKKGSHKGDKDHDFGLLDEDDDLMHFLLKGGSDKGKPNPDGDMAALLKSKFGKDMHHSGMGGQDDMFDGDHSDARKPFSKLDPLTPGVAAPVPASEAKATPKSGSADAGTPKKDAPSSSIKYQGSAMRTHLQYAMMVLPLVGFVF